jgi:hypothetical protein
MTYKAKNMIVVYQSDSDGTYAEHYDIDDVGKLKNRAPVGEDFLDGIVKSKEKPTQSEFIPSNILYNNSRFLIFYTKKKKYEITLKKDSETLVGKVNIPNIVWKIDHLANRMYAYMTKDIPLKHDAEIYPLPFPNILGGNEICWGQVGIMHVTDVKLPIIPDRVFHLFFDSAFNNHGDISHYNELRNEIITKKPRKFKFKNGKKLYSIA